MIRWTSAVVPRLFTLDAAAIDMVMAPASVRVVWYARPLSESGVAVSICTDCDVSVQRSGGVVTLDTACVRTVHFRVPRNIFLRGPPATSGHLIVDECSDGVDNDGDRVV
jgi:hypothetical protein